ncbi:MAG TPA: GNAT family N-acetyltransferase [Stellaceae bacterium]|nr:GNAT family N-acetyltransferase [Stellaceae bacterium]
MVGLVTQFASELGASAELQIDETEWRRNSLGPSPKFSALIAECEAETVGVATYSPLYLPDSGKEAVYVHHLYVVESMRRQGVGKALLAQIAAQATGKDQAVIELGTILTTPRRRFFEAAGFHVVAGYATYILFGEGLAALASLPLDGLS